MIVLGCCRIEEIRDDDNKTGLEEGRVIKMSTTSAPFASRVKEMSTTSAPFTLTIKLQFYYSDTIYSQTWKKIIFTKITVLHYAMHALSLDIPYLFNARSAPQEKPSPLPQLPFPSAPQGLPLEYSLYSPNSLTRFCIAGKQCADNSLGCLPWSNSPWHCSLALDKMVLDTPGAPWVW